MKLGKYSIGIGDRFGRSAVAQLKAIMDFSAANNLIITPVWNKSFREHCLIGSAPSDTLQSVQSAVGICNYLGEYFLDADHINLNNVGIFLEPCNFFTIDVADKIGKQGSIDDKIFKDTLKGYIGKFGVTKEIIDSVSNEYLYAIFSAKECYEFIKHKKVDEDFVIEISMDETLKPQTPAELFCIAYGLSFYGIPAATIAPKFSGEFHKGIDYIGSPEVFAQEFADDIDVLAFAQSEFGLNDIKLSIHSGSDKFLIYPLIKKIIKEKDAGVHLKTAGTTWLAEVAGLARSSVMGLQFAKKIYELAYARYYELSAPYATVISIDRLKLPSICDIAAMTSDDFVSMLDHNLDNPKYDTNFRQFIHIAFKVAAEDPAYLELLNKYSENIDKEVYDNIYTKHLSKLF